MNTSSDSAMEIVSFSAEDDSDVHALHTLLSFWGISHGRDGSGAHLRIDRVRDDFHLNVRDSEKTELVVIAEDAMEKILAKNELPYSRRRNVPIRVTLQGTDHYTVLIDQVYEIRSHDLEAGQRIGGMSLAYRIRGTKTHLLSFDLVGLFNRILESSLNDLPTAVYKLWTKFPIRYEVVPKSIRDYMLRRRVSATSPDYSEFCSIDGLLFLFLALLLTCSGKTIPTLAFWKNGMQYAFAVSHDVESSSGLDSSSKLRDVEEEVGIRSSWNIPSHRYEISREVVSGIARNHIIGGHDTKHDGRLVVQRTDRLADRLILCREKLSRLSNSQVTGFRAPLLQHSRTLLQAIRNAGFYYDSSCPTWEPASCVSGKFHGIRTIFPQSIDGLIELPVTLPQDHQMLYVLRESPEECVHHWLRYSDWIKRVGGMVLLLVHPEYSFCENANIPLYRRFLKAFTWDGDCWVTTTEELAHWWKGRCESSVKHEGGVYTVEASEELKNQNSLKVRLFTGYDDARGFRSLTYGEIPIVQIAA